jgi:hypothetical protein
MENEFIIKIAIIVTPIIIALVLLLVGLKGAHKLEEEEDVLPPIDLTKGKIVKDPIPPKKKTYKRKYKRKSE